MSKTRTGLVMVGLLAIASVGAFFIFSAANHFLSTDSSQCHTPGINHRVNIQNDAFSVQKISGLLCDTLTITNIDDKIRNIAFGEHDDHQPYNGVTEKILQKNGSFTITFDKTGTFEVHDHLQNETQAFFTVTK
jgi:plastocyanin